MIDVGRRMRALLPRLQEGPKNGYGAVNARAECEEEWSPKYAIVQDVSYDPEADELPYFDHAAWQADMVEMIVQAFMKKGEPDPVVAYRGDSVKVTTQTPKKRVFQKWVAPGTIVIHWHGFPTNEVEVYVAELKGRPYPAAVTVENGHKKVSKKRRAA